jgi:hypothetical protein
MKILQRTGILILAALLAAAAPAQAQDGSFEQTLNVTGPVNLSVDTRSGSIVVRGGSTGEVVIRGEIRLQRNWMGMKGGSDTVAEIEQNPPITQTGNTIRIAKLDRNLGRRISLSYEITVPENTKIDADTGSGSIRLSDVQGPVDADTGSGGIEIENIAAGATLDTGSGSIRASGVRGSFSADTGSGSIRAELLGGGPVDLDTGSGSIRVSGVDGRLKASAGSGSVTAEGNPTGDWEIESGSGSVNVTFPGNASFDLSARTSSGSVRTDFPITVQGSLSKKRLTGKVGNGGPRVDLRSGSGNIRIEEGGSSAQ